MTNFKSNLIIVCYLKGKNKYLGHCDHLLFKGYKLKWRNTRSMFYDVIVLDHMFYKITIYVLYKI